MSLTNRDISFVLACRAIHLSGWMAAVLLILLVTPPVFGANAKPIVIRYPHFHEEEKIYAKRTLYLVDLLKLSLEKSAQPYTLKPIPIATITGNRNTRYLKTGVYDINWMHTDSEREHALVPIRVPLFRGLIGWRIFLIRSNDQGLYSEIETVSDLKKLTTGQGYDWPDTTILRYNDFKLIPSISPPTLTKMLLGKRIDFFPRGILEAWEEIDIIDNNSLSVEKKFVLQYPTAKYFFVAPDNKALASTIEKGLMLAIEDGSFEKLFFEYYGKEILESRLSERKIIHLPNPYLSSATPINNKALWFSVADISRIPADK